VLASVSARRWRLLPVEFGSTTYAETIEHIPVVEDASRRWLERVGYTGLAELEFKYHSGTRTYKLLDVNVRAWGWHPLCAYAGVDFPHLAWQLAVGREVPPVSARVGAKWVRTPYDLMSSIQLNRRGALTWAAYFKSLRGAHHEMYQLDDLLPAVFEVPLLFQLVWNKLRHR
jgi:predicted ATP-grasp superfamily ATP-dependent carboligase